MVSPSKPNHSRVASQQQSTNKCKLLKGNRPLLNYKFYLDIEKHHISNKIETKIKELGGSVEFFLDKKVTHFVTDRQLDREQSCSSPHTPRTPQTPHTPVTPYRNDLNDFVAGSPTETKANGSKPRSRVDAILQRARVQPYENNSSIRLVSAVNQSNNPQSPVNLAKSWGTPIWTPEYALKFLDKVASSAAKLSTNPQRFPKGKPANIKHLRGDYIKIEAFDRHHRPYYKEINPWPFISLNQTSGDSPFVHRNTERPANKESTFKSNKMTRKNRSKQMRTTRHDMKRSSEKQCGYCEICRLEYDVLSVHLQSAEHLNFSKNDTNFVALDSLINDRANVECFLKANEPATNYIDNEFFGKRSSGRIMAKLIRACESDVKPEAECDINRDFNNRYSPPRKRLHNRRSDPTDLKVSPKDCSPTKINLSPCKTDPNCDFGRSRRESVKRVNYDETIEDEENTEGDSEDSDEKKIKKIRLRGIRWRPQSPDNPAAMSQPIIYKVVNEKSKSPSKTGSSKKGGPLSEQNKSQTGLKVKICRVRESELARLTNEADHFMFPRVFSDHPTDEDRQSSSERGDQTAEIPSSEYGSPRSTKHLSSPAKQNQIAECDGSSRRKRRNHLEKFLDDNSEYYKFQKPESRLRFQEAPVQPNLTNDRCDDYDDDGIVVSSKSKFTTNDNDVESMEDGTGEYHGHQKYELSDKVNSLHFSFERVPRNESWYATFQRQDECRERFFEYWGSTAYRKLPFELGPLPPLSSDCCTLSKLNLSKRDKRQTSRKKRGRHPKKVQIPMAAAETKLIQSTTKSATSEKADKLDRSENIEMPILVKQESRKNSDSTVSSKCSSGLSIKLKNPFSVAAAAAKAESSTATKRTIPKNLIIDFKSESHSNSGSDCSGERPKSSLSLSKKLALLGEYNHPRKSPREHASTLAILSCLVQQRRKQETQLNGGISLEPQNDTDIDEDDDDGAETNCFQYEDAEALNIAETTTADVPIKTEEDVQLSSNENSNHAESMPHPIICNGALSRLNSIKTEKEDVEMISKTANEVPPDDPVNIPETIPVREFKMPKVPDPNYVDPKLLCRQLDNLLDNAYQQSEDPFTDLAIPKNCDDLVLISTPKDFVEIIISVDQGPMRYGFTSQLKKKHGLSSFVRCGRRRRNKTGWPTIPRRRSTMKHLIEDTECISNSHSNTDLDENDDERSNTVEISQSFENETDELYIHSRQKLNSQGEDCSKDDDFSNDENSVLFASSSDKAENSDIFTVSSDSLDTVINASQPERDFDRKSMKSLLSVSDESSSADVTLAEMLKKQIGVNDKLKRNLPSTMKSKSKKSNRRRNGGGSVKRRRKKGGKLSSKKGAKLPIMQPVVCVKKIDVNLLNNQCEQMMTRTMSGNLIDSSNNKLINNCETFCGDDEQILNNDSNVNRRNSSQSPQATFSPRKLRKPRGRWYRER